MAFFTSSFPVFNFILLRQGVDVGLEYSIRQPLLQRAWFIECNCEMCTCCQVNVWVIGVFRLLQLTVRVVFFLLEDEY